jgi:NADP-dependent 3-hydroxy acid dehydrogenase YdfG
MKTALIFGHSNGLGEVVSRRLLQNNCRVVGVARSAPGYTSPNLASIQADLSNTEALRVVLETIKSDYAKFDFLVFTAGVLLGSSWGALRYSDMEFIYKVNVLAPIMIESSLIGQIKTNGATVLNVTSSTTTHYYPNLVPYAASKAALRKFTEDLQNELQYTNARAIDFCPGGFTSTIYQTMLGEKIERDEMQQINIDDMADLVVYLLNSHPMMRINNIFVGRRKSIEEVNAYSNITPVTQLR